MVAFPLLLRLHAAVGLVVFLFFGYKLLLLLTGRREQLRQVRARTRWADGVLLGATLLSGASAWATTPAPGPGFLALWLGVEAFLLACVWMLRRESASLAFGNLLGAVVLFGSTLAFIPPGLPPQPQTGASLPTPARAQATPNAVAPVDTLALAATDQALLDSVQTAAAGPAAAPVLAAGQTLYTRNCAVCHGPDGKLGLNGARNLTRSNLNAAGRIYQVTNGSLSKKMPAFRNKLSEEEIRQVVAYSLTLR